MRARGTGCVYRRKDKAGRPIGPWLLKLSVGGRVTYKSSKTTNRREAERKLRALLTAAEARGDAPEPETVTLQALVQLILDDYRANERKSAARVRQAVRHIAAFFGEEAQADRIDNARLSAYMRQRLESGARPATVRIELGVLSRMFALAYRAGLIPKVPPLPTLQVRNTRTGFFEERELRAVLEHLPDYMQGFVWFAYYTGWRRSEISGLRWKDVDLEARTVRLEPGTTKNDDGRTFPFATHAGLLELLNRQRAVVRELERERGSVIPWVFPGPNGRRLTWFYDPWRQACEKARVPRLFHGLRRTAVRNLERAGGPRSSAMKLTGHRTESIYRRYAIVSEADLAEAVSRVGRLHGPMHESARTVAVGCSESDSSDNAATDMWRPQRDSKETNEGNHRRFPSAKRGKARACGRSQTTGTDGSRRSTGTVRGQLRDSGFNFQFAWSSGTVAGRAAAAA